MKIQLKLSLVLSALVLIPLFFVSLLAVESAERRITNQFVSQLQSVAAIQENRIRAALLRYVEQTKLITSRTQLRVTLADHLQAPAPEHVERLTQTLNDAKTSTEGLQVVSIFDLNGTVVASTDTTFASEHELNANLLEIGQREHQLVDVVRNADNQIFAQLVGPLTLDGETLGVIEVLAEADLFLRVIEDYEGLGESGETLFARATPGGDALFLTPLKFDTDAALVRTVASEAANVPIIYALAGEEIALITSDIVDYRGVPVLAATRIVDELGWGIVAKIDRTEALAPVTTFKRSLLVIAIVVAILVVLLTWFVAKSIARPLLLLDEASQKIAGGDFRIAKPVVLSRAQDEVGTLAQSFFAMAKKLQESYRGLEKKVADRTTKLEQANKESKGRAQELTRSQEASLNIMEDLQDEQAKLAKAKARDEAVLTSMADALAVMELDGTITRVNTAFEALTGWKPAEAVGKKFTEVIRSEEEDGEPVPEAKRSVSTALSHGRVFQRDAEHQHYYFKKDGSRFPVDARATAILQDGKIVGATEVFRDITREYEVDRAKTEFVSLASHQLRTPLSAVNWYTEMLLAGDAGKLNEEQQKYLHEVYASNQRMVDLVNALLNVSRIELGTFTVERESCDVTAITRSVLDELKPQIDERQLSIETKLGEIPKYQADAKLLRIVLQNLLSNAVKYTPEKGTVTVSTTLTSDNLIIKVQDTGLGIPKDQQEQIFTKLFRADNVRETDTEGTGLGLYIVKAIAEHSSGSVHFVSRENQGTTFTVTLPAAGMIAREGTRRVE